MYFVDLFGCFGMGLELLESVSIELESEPSKVSRKYMVRIGVLGGIHYYNAFQCIDFRSFCYVIGPNKSRWISMACTLSSIS